MGPPCSAMPAGYCVIRGLSVLEQLIKRKPNVFGDLTEQDWGDISTLMKRNRCAAACGIAKLFVCPRCRTSVKPSLVRMAMTSLGLRMGTLPMTQATATFWTPTNSDSSVGSPSSRSIAITSCRLWLSSSSVSPWEWAPGKPGTKPTNKPVFGHRSITAEYTFMAGFKTARDTNYHSMLPHKQSPMNINPSQT